MSNISWTCPFCGRPTTVTGNDVSGGRADLQIDNSVGHRRLLCRYVVCPNPDCKKFTLETWLHERIYDDLGNADTGEMLQHWRLIPHSTAKVFPEYIPKPILEDYSEACLIKGLSPKASATLSRRCLQGIIRDFWKVKSGKLVDEIEQIKDKVDPLTWGAIDAVRKVGNIGAHMEKDINLIVEVDANEAELLIGLIETLIRDWYITREEREKRLGRIKEIAKLKDDSRKAGQ